MNSSPDFSIVIPLYNKEKYIARAVESVLAQSVSNFQLIIVDDGSTDSSFDIASSITDTRIELFQQENLGNGPARNAGILRSKSNWVAYLDADDMWYQDHLAELKKIRNYCPNANLISTQLIYSEVGDIFPTRRAHSNHIEYICYFSEAIVNPGIVSSSSAAVNLETLAKHALFENYPRGTDTECWARIALKHQVAISRKQTAIYFRGTGGITDTFAETDAIYKNPVKDLTAVSPSVALVWEATRSASESQRAALFAYSTHLTKLYIARALYRRQFQNAIKVSSLAATYSIRFRMVHQFLRVQSIAVPSLDFLRGCKRLLRRIRMVR